ncbi:MAG: hypothetical protein AB7O62_26170 [Pirellulales bacterium]
MFQSRGSVAVTLTAFTAMLFLLYVLSIGPAAMMWNRGRISMQGIETAYYPVLAFTRHGSLLRPVLRGYVAYWLPPGGFFPPLVCG